VNPIARFLITATLVARAVIGAGAQPQPPAQTAAGRVAWKSAAPGRAIVLPADHASHPDYKLEWWYYTGNLDGASGERFGYQLTFFRVGVDPAPANRSRWAVRDLFMTHLALTDINGRRHLFTERLNRSGPGWAGAETGQYRVWNQEWEARLDGTRHRLTAVGSSSDRTPLRFGIDLTLDETQPPALHGDQGYSRKGTDPGNASHYYSLTRMPTRGSVTVDGKTVPVTGLSWMDHEFGTSFLEPGQIGWDWFAIQLSDGRDLMLYRFRRSDNVADPRSSGTLIDARGLAVPVSLVDVRLEPGRTWTSPVSKASYPVAWRVSLPRERLDLQIAAVLDAQELRTTESTDVTYWEGAIDVRGTADGKPVTGRGYLEMTGYSGAPMGNYLR